VTNAIVCANCGHYQDWRRIFYLLEKPTAILLFILACLQLWMSRQERVDAGRAANETRRVALAFGTTSQKIVAELKEYGVRNAQIAAETRGAIEHLRNGVTDPQTLEHLDNNLKGLTNAIQGLEAFQSDLNGLSSEIENFNRDVAADAEGVERQ
jgi:hypothetical protein